MLNDRSGSRSFRARKTPLRSSVLRLENLEAREVMDAASIVGPLTPKQAVQFYSPSAPTIEAPSLPALNSVSDNIASAVAAQWDVPVGTKTSEWVVQFPADKGPDSLKSLGMTSYSPLPNWNNTYTVDFATSQDIQAFAPTLASASGSSLFFPSIARQASKRFVPNDPLFSDEFHLINVGQSGGVPGEDARVTTAWDLTDNLGNPIRGTGVQIAIVDDGLQRTHPDLAPNYVALGSRDFNNNDNDPTPGPFDDHGTSAAGVAAARGNNGIGVSGAAPNANLAGIRLISAPVTGAVEAQGVGYLPDVNQIYNNSWGPSDNGRYATSNFPQTIAALGTNTSTGRGGKGSIYVWAAGNGLQNHDNVNYDSYANSRYVIAVGAVTDQGVQAYYSEPGSPMLVNAPSNGGVGPGITTTDVTGTGGYNTNGFGNYADTNYTNDFGGTSSAAPLVSGIVALMLQANPNLGWRDVKTILLQTARKNDPNDAGWAVNGAGYHINEKYGFGTIDATAAVNLAKNWTNLAAETSFSTGTINVNQPIPDNDTNGISDTVTVNQDISLEQIEVNVSVPDHTYVGDLGLVLEHLDNNDNVISQSVLAETRTEDSSTGLNWTFTTVRHWGESSSGKWRLTVADGAAQNTGTWANWKINFYGTDKVPDVSGLETTPLTFLENQAPIQVTSSLGITDDANLTQATVTINGFVPGQDVLGFTDSGGINGFFDPVNGVLTFTGVGTPAEYQSVLRSVTYNNTSNNPSTALRTLTFQVQDDTSNLSTIVSRDLNVVPVNDSPLFDFINNLNIDEDSGPQTISIFNITPGDLENQQLTLTVSSDDTSIIPTPTKNYTSPNTAGTISFTPVSKAFGTAHIKVTLQDNGGTANGGVDLYEQTFTVTVNPVNDAPTFSLQSDTYAPVNAGAQSVPNFASNIVFGPPNESNQTGTFTATVSNTDSALFTVLPQISPNGTLTFTGAPNATGLVKVDVSLQDSGGTAFNGKDTSTTQSFVIFLGVNRAPVLDNSGNPTLNPVASGTLTPTPTLVSQFASVGVTDPDGNVSNTGVAIITADNSIGRWEYSINGGTTWANLAPVSASTARLLRPNDLVRFFPNQGFIGKSSLTYYAWDQSSGVAGTTVDLSSVAARGVDKAFSVASESATLRIASIFSSSPEDTPLGKPVSSISGASVVDPDSSKKPGIAIIGTGGTLAGHWEFSSSNKWFPFGTVSDSQALLLRSTDKLRFVPDANQSGEAFLTYRAWDGSVGTVGSKANISGPGKVGGSTPFSVGTDSIFARVTAVNDRPILDVATPAKLTQIVPTLDESLNFGDTVASVLGSSVTDADAGTVPGIAVTAYTKVGGFWQYKFGNDEWRFFRQFPGLSATSAFLLRATDRIRFVPDGDVSVTPTITFKAWDGSSGTPGTIADSTKTTAFSTGVKSASISVTTDPVPVANVAPVLNTVPVIPLTPINEDSKPNGDLVLNYVTNNVTDNDGPLRGFALTNVTGTANGVWQYSSNGTTWKNVGLVSVESALLLQGSDKIRFLPNKDFNGQVSISYKAWDQSSGTPGQYANLALSGTTGGSTAFSVSTGTSALTVLPVNDAPVLDNKPDPIFTSITPGNTNSAGNTVASLLGNALSDVDANPLRGIGIIGANSTKGKWQFKLQGSNSWSDIVGATSSNALVLKDVDLVRFVPSSNFTGSEKLTYRGWDQTSGTAGLLLATNQNTSLSKDSETATILVNTVNNNPVLTQRPTIVLDPLALNQGNSTGFLASTLLGSFVTDPNAGDSIGIAITGADNKNGRWEFYVDDGSPFDVNKFFFFGNLSNTSAVLLKANDRLRFVPNAGYAGTTTITFKAWDQTNGILAGSAATTLNSSFSTKSQSAILAVNIAPTLTT